MQLLYIIFVFLDLDLDLDFYDSTPHVGKNESGMCVCCA